jgi:hypothetical protein
MKLSLLLNKSLNFQATTGSKEEKEMKICFLRLEVRHKRRKIILITII